MNCFLGLATHQSQVLRRPLRSAYVALRAAMVPPFRVFSSVHRLCLVSRCPTLNALHSAHAAPRSTPVVHRSPLAVRLRRPAPTLAVRARLSAEARWSSPIACCWAIGARRPAWGARRVPHMRSERLESSRGVGRVPSRAPPRFMCERGTGRVPYESRGDRDSYVVRARFQSVSSRSSPALILRGPCRSSPHAPPNSS